MGEPERRRRRLRTPSSAPAPADPAAADPPAVETPLEPVIETAAIETAAIEDPVEESAPQPTPRAPYAGRPARSPGPGGDDREAERGLRGLVGSGSSQVSVGAALRARDAARPSEAQLADAEENLVIVRRNWQPREDLPHNR